MTGTDFCFVCGQYTKGSSKSICIYLMIMFENFLFDNLAELTIAFLALVKVVVNLTPTEKDNQVFGWFDALINMIIADRKKTPED